MADDESTAPRLTSRQPGDREDEHDEECELCSAPLIPVGLPGKVPPRRGGTAPAPPG